jgi:hypothetical protein
MEASKRMRGGTEAMTSEDKTETMRMKRNMRWKPLYLILACLHMSACSLLPNYQNEPISVDINEEDESQFGIELPLASYNFDQCVELADHNCKGNIEDVYDISIKNTFELWQETKLTFGIVPQPNERLVLSSLDAVDLFVYDESKSEWIAVPFLLDSPGQNIIDSGNLLFLPNCSPNKDCTIHPYSSLVTLVFSPRQSNDHMQTYKLNIELHKADKIGKPLEEVVTASKIFDFTFPVEESDPNLAVNWSGIDMSAEMIENANQKFTLFAPKDLNPFLIQHPFHVMDGRIDMVLTIRDAEVMDFGLDLQLDIYQFNEMTVQWEKLDPEPPFSVYSNVGEFVYSPNPDDLICTECVLMNKELSDGIRLGALPRLMQNGDGNYLVFILYFDKSKLIAGNNLVRVIAKTDNGMAYYDIRIDQ